MSEVIDFTQRKNGSFGVKPEAKPVNFEFHLFTDESSEASEELVQGVRGFLKFGPQFLVVVDHPTAEDAQVVFSVATPLVKYVRRIAETGETQGTLSL